MQQSVNGSEFAYKPQEQAPSQCRTSPEVSAQHHIGKWGRMHRAYLEEGHPDLYRQLLQYPRQISGRSGREGCQHAGAADSTDGTAGRCH
ncbi:MAG: TnpV protein [Clostridia bacterium]|nr:TnpV protein [Clostridia bacterium]